MMAKTGESDDDGVYVHNGYVRKDVSGKLFQSQLDVPCIYRFRSYCNCAVIFVKRNQNCTVAGKLESCAL